jgi:hypothetical protein
MSEANRIRAQTYMPKARAFQIAKTTQQETNNECSSNVSSAPTVPLGWIQELPVAQRPINPKTTPAVNNTDHNTSVRQSPSHDKDCSPNTAKCVLSSGPSSSHTSQETKLAAENKKLLVQVESLQKTVDRLQRQVEKLSQSSSSQPTDLSENTTSTSTLNSTGTSLAQQTTSGGSIVRRLYDSLGINAQFLSTLHRIYEFSQKNELTL